ncbi:MAG: hypothetical protein V7605_1092 [Acidimicrobiaceae bacterium]|jgi:hypothetical protein
MPEDDQDEVQAAHGVHGAQRGDGEMQEQPNGGEGVDAESWAEATETGGEAT